MNCMEQFFLEQENLPNNTGNIVGQTLVYLNSYLILLKMDPQIILSSSLTGERFEQICMASEAITQTNDDGLKQTFYYLLFAAEFANRNNVDASSFSRLKNYFGLLCPSARDVVEQQLISLTRI